jgi:hypothetical protein
MDFRIPVTNIRITRVLSMKTRRPTAKRQIRVGCKMVTDLTSEK